MGNSNVSKFSYLACRQAVQTEEMPDFVFAGGARDVDFVAENKNRSRCYLFVVYQTLQETRKKELINQY